MRIWRFSDPGNNRYASAGRRGSWTASDGVCPECGSSRQQRAQPLIIVWELGSDVVGDFVWPGFGSEVVVAERVFDALESNFAGFERGPVEMIEEPELARDRGRRVTLPYEGPGLFELWTTAWVDVDLEHSTIRLDWRCAACGTERWTIDGVEHWDSVFDQREQTLEPTRVRRLPNAGIYVRQEELDAVDIFRVAQAPAWVLCTDAVRELIHERRFTNVDFLEIGETINQRV